MPTAKRTMTKAGVGDLKSSGIRRFGSRDTVPAPPIVEVDEAAAASEVFTPPPEKSTGRRRKMTLDIAMSFAESKPVVTITEPPAGNERAKKSKPPREAIRVDEVPTRAKKVTLRGAVAHVPRIVNAARVSKAPLDSRDAFVLSMIDGVLSLPELADATGMAEDDVEKIVTRLVRLGIASM